MDSATIAAVTFACTFGGALVGIYLRRVLPDSHLNSDSKDVIKMGTGLLATLAALVLGLLIASAKSSYDAQRSGFQQLASNIILLDRSLTFYGPETKEIRERLRSIVKLLLEHPGPHSEGLASKEITQNAAAFYIAIQTLAPKTDAQKSIQSQAIQVSSDLARTRWSLSQGDEASIPTPFLAILVFWLFVLFTTFGLFSPRNATVIAILLICALSLSGALFLIVELDRPFHGLIRISTKPLNDAYGQLGQ